MRLTGLRAALGTMHGKEAAIAPPLARLGVEVIVPDGLDTDRFGAFTGEVPRAGTMMEAARAKAQAAIAATGLAAGIASEGSYGPHPVVPFAAFGHELILWRDEAGGLEIVETLVDDSPCYWHEELAALDEAEAFLTRIGFPETAVIVAPTGGAVPLAKGIRARTALAEAIAAAARQSSGGRALVQTDMRAHLNPRRMQTIARLADALARRLATPCPACNAPGFGRTRVEAGLPCGGCGLPTDMIAREIFGCAACGHEQPRPRPDGLTAADPRYCAFCNP